MINTSNLLNKIVRSSILFSMAVLILAGCNSNEKTTPRGFTYTVLKAGDNVLPKPNQIVVYDFVLRDSKDSVWSDTYKDGMPRPIMIGDTSKLKEENGMLQMFRQVSKGDSIQVKLPVTKFFKDIVRQGVPPEIDSTLNITITVAIKDIMEVQAYQAYQLELAEKQSQLQVEKDKKIIEDYLAKNNVKAELDSSGIYFVLHDGKGKAKPNSTSCVKVNYVGKFLDNPTPFDQNIISFTLNEVMNGWKIGIPMMGVGDSATLYVPSRLGYGPRGYPGAIPPNSVLMFNIRLLDFKANMNPQTRTCID